MATASFPGIRCEQRPSVIIMAIYESCRIVRGVTSLIFFRLDLFDLVTPKDHATHILFTDDNTDADQRGATILSNSDPGYGKDTAAFMNNAGRESVAQ